MREQEQKEREDKILLHRPRVAATPEAPGQAPSTQAVMRALDAAAEAQKAKGQ